MIYMHLKIWVALVQVIGNGGYDWVVGVALYQMYYRGLCERYYEGEANQTNSDRMYSNSQREQSRLCNVVIERL